MKQNGAVYYYITNLQGDVVRLVNSAGNTAAWYKYDPYGNATTASGSHATINPLRYRGYYYDTETGLYYCQSRYYDPAIGRWINADSFVSTGQGVVGHNLFAYCLNDPIGRKDIGGKFQKRYSMMVRLMSILLMIHWGGGGSVIQGNGTRSNPFVGGSYSAGQSNVSPNSGHGYTPPPGGGGATSTTAVNGVTILHLCQCGYLLFYALVRRK